MNGLSATQVVPVIRTTLAVLGAYFSYQGMVSRRGVLARYMFWFFLINLFTRMGRTLLGMITPTDPVVFRANLAIWAGISTVIGFVGLSAYAVLVYGCYVALRSDTNA